MKYSIFHLETFLVDNKLGVRLYLEGYKNKDEQNFVTLPFELIKKIYNIKPTELELLIGSSLEPIYYQSGERLPSGHIVKNFSATIKKWKLIFSYPLEETRVKNKSLLLNFERIGRANKIFEKENLSSVTTLKFFGDYPYSRDYDTNNKYLISTKRLEVETGLNPLKFYLISGSLISPQYFAAGEFDDLHQTYIRKDNTIIKTLNLRVDKDLITSFNIFTKFKSRFCSYEQLDEGSKRKNYSHNDFIDDALGGHADAIWNLD